jgi:hypothetical protein
MAGNPVDNLKYREIPMIRQTVLTLALAATAVLAPAAANAAPMSNVLHLHPHTSQQDSRISFNLYNKGFATVEFTANGQVFTVAPQATVRLLAPEGTVVYAGANYLLHKRGDAVLTVKPELRGQQIRLN